jgi:hypothetical protein
MILPKETRLPEPVYRPEDIAALEFHSPNLFVCNYHFCSDLSLGRRWNRPFQSLTGLLSNVVECPFRALHDGSTEQDFDAPSADQLAVPRRRKNGQLFWRELFFAVIATDAFVHPAVPTRKLGRKRDKSGSSVRRIPPAGSWVHGLIGVFGDAKMTTAS